MYEQWTTSVYPMVQKPYEHAGQEFNSEFLQAALQNSKNYDEMVCWLGHGDL